MKHKVYVIAGPTASGKSALALEVAERYDCEIISMDSMQIYRRLDIGSAKPSHEEMERVRHHMIDICDPRESFSCADYVRMACECVEDIVSRNKTPLFVGGTGLYLDGLMYKRSYEEYQKSDDVLAYREELNRLCEERGVDYIHSMLREIDPESADSIHPNNVKRVIRALEIARETGKTKSEADRESREKDGEKRFDMRTVILTYPERSVLYERIDKRVDIMLDSGLLEETRALYSDGILSENTTAAMAIGYKELVPYIKGEASLEQVSDTLKRATRRYAKRQITWFSRYKDASFLNMSENNFESFVNFCATVFYKE